MKLQSFLFFIGFPINYDHKLSGWPIMNKNKIRYNNAVEHSLRLYFTIADSFSLQADIILIP